MKHFWDLLFQLMRHWTNTFIVELIFLQCLRKVFRSLDFFHILLLYRLLLKLIQLLFSPSSIYTQYLIMTKQEQVFRIFNGS